MSWGKDTTLFRVHPSIYGAAQFNPSNLGNARFSPLLDATGHIIPTIYAGTTLDCALMETVFHDVPFEPGDKFWSKASHIEGKVYSVVRLNDDLNLIDLSSVALRKLGISRKELIESDASEYRETREWALALHRAASAAQGMIWISRQDDAARAFVLFEDRIPAGTLTVVEERMPLLQSDTSPITPVLILANRLGVLITP